MNEPKHTPGPWIADDHPREICIRPQGTGWLLATISLDWFSAQYHDTKANARLIAAAPDMLEALERAARRWERERVNGMGSLAKLVANGASDADIARVVRATAVSKRGAYERFRDDLRAAIAKAKGEA